MKINVHFYGEKKLAKKYVTNLHFRDKYKRKHLKEKENGGFAKEFFQKSKFEFENWKR